MAVQRDNKETYMSHEATLREFIHVLNTHDLDRIMSFFCDDCIFFAAAGELPNGSAFRGIEEVRSGFARIFATYTDANWSQDNHFASGSRGFSEWTFSGTTGSGDRISVRGCDAFVFQAGRIQVKDSFRKQT